jgi:hypothetical protein
MIKLREKTHVWRTHFALSGCFQAFLHLVIVIVIELKSHSLQLASWSLTVSWTRNLRATRTKMAQNTMDASVATIDDLRVKLCYICREEETDETEGYDEKGTIPGSDNSEQNSGNPTPHDPISSSVNPASDTLHPQRASSPAPVQRWVHPCTCTLIAHEACLLQWIRSAQTTRGQREKALKCPQCGSAYELVSDTPLALPLLRVANLLSDFAGTTVLAGVGVCVVAAFAGG